MKQEFKHGDFVKTTNHNIRIWRMDGVLRANSKPEDADFCIFLENNIKWGRYINMVCVSTREQVVVFKHEIALWEKTNAS